MSFAKATDLLRLAGLCGAHVGMTLADVSAECGVSVRTAQRMFDALESAFPGHVEVVWLPGQRKHWRLEPEGLKDLVTLTAEELAALDLAVEAIGRSSQTQEARHLAELRRKVLALMPRTGAARLETDHEALLVAQGLAARPGPRPHSDPAVDDAVSQAIKAVCLLDVTYHAGGAGPPVRRRIAPYGILSGNRRYVVARDTGAGDDRLRMFRMDGISAAVVTQDGFELDPDFDLRTFAKRSFGVFQSEAEYGEVVWRFAPAAAERALGFQFHPGQQVEREAGGSLTVRFHAAGHLEMCWHLYAWGDQVEVLAPEALRELCAAHRRSDFAALP